MISSLVMAIDPGAHGALATHRDDFPDQVHPLEFASTRDLMYQFDLGAPFPRIAFIEKVGGYVGKPQPGSSAFKFGRSCGLVEGFLVAFSYEIRWVRPQAWQKHFSALTRPGEAKAEHKRRLRNLALERFPHLSKEITLTTCDALLLLAYGLAQLRLERAAA